MLTKLRKNQNAIFRYKDRRSEPATLTHFMQKQELEQSLRESACRLDLEQTITDIDLFPDTADRKPIDHPTLAFNMD